MATSFAGLGSARIAGPDEPKRKADHVRLAALAVPLPRMRRDNVASATYSSPRQGLGLGSGFELRLDERAASTAETPRPTFEIARPSLLSYSEKAQNSYSGVSGTSRSSSRRPSPTAMSMAGSNLTSISGASGASSARPYTSSLAPSELPFLPSGSARILQLGSAAMDEWRLRTANARDAHAIANTKSYYDTQGGRLIDRLNEINKSLILNNPKRAEAQQHRKDLIELDNKLLKQRVIDTPISLPPPDLKAREVGERQLNNAIESRQRRMAAIRRQNALMRKNMERQPPAVDMQLRPGIKVGGSLYHIVPPSKDGKESAGKEGASSDEEKRQQEKRPQEKRPPDLKNRPEWTYSSHAGL